MPYAHRAWMALSMVLFAAGAFASAEGPRGFEKRLGQMLDLSAEQTKQVVEIRKKHHDQFRTIHQDVRALKKDLRAALQAPQTGAEYRAELQKKFEAVQKRKRDLADARFAMAMEVREILKPEQLSKFRGLRPAMGHKGREDEN